MKKSLLCSAALFIFTAVLFAEPKAFDLVNECTKKATADESAEYLEKEITKITVPSEKRAAYAFLGNLQEMLGLYDLAEKSYVSAAGIAGSDAENMPVHSNEELVLDAVRCALSGGNYGRADSYLNSAVRSSKNARVQSYVKLYAIWSNLCRAENKEDLEEPVAMLKAYANVSSMKEVQPAILLTLWYITGNSSYAGEIKEKFPSSLECSIVKGDTQLLPSPFWYFVPKSGEAKPEAGTVKETDKNSGSAKTEQKETDSVPGGKLQMGLFSSESNANHLVTELKDKGFDAYFEKQTKPSGNVYYSVIVNARDNITADILRSSGYECYLITE